MQPTMDLRLKSMSRSIESVILPAIDSENALAINQAHVINAHIAMLRHLIDHLPAYERLEQRAARLFAAELARAATGGPVVEAAVAALEGEIRRAADVDESAPASLRGSAESLAGASEAVVLALGVDGDPDARSRVIRLSMEALGESSQRELRWFDTAHDPGAILTEWQASLMEGERR